MPHGRTLTRRLLCWAAVFFAISAARTAQCEADRVEAGRRLAYEITKGNCLACHSAPSDPEAVTRANIGPPLIGMRKRFPDRHALRARIWDPTRNNPNTVMPPFGRHKILSEPEIDLIIDFL